MSDMVCTYCGATGTLEEWKNGFFAHLDCQIEQAYTEYEAEREMDWSLYAEDVIGGLEV